MRALVSSQRSRVEAAVITWRTSFINEQAARAMGRERGLRAASSIRSVLRGLRDTGARGCLANMRRNQMGAKVEAAKTQTILLMEAHSMSKGAIEAHAGALRDQQRRGAFKRMRYVMEMSRMTGIRRCITTMRVNLMAAKSEQTLRQMEGQQLSRTMYEMKGSALDRMRVVAQRMQLATQARAVKAMWASWNGDKVSNAVAEERVKADSRAALSLQKLKDERQTLASKTMLRVAQAWRLGEARRCVVTLRTNHMKAVMQQRVMALEAEHYAQMLLDMKDSATDRMRLVLRRMQNVTLARAIRTMTRTWHRSKTEKAVSDIAAEANSITMTLHGELRERSEQWAQELKKAMMGSGGRVLQQVMGAWRHADLRRCIVSMGRNHVEAVGEQRMQQLQAEYGARVTAGLRGSAVDRMRAVMRRLQRVTQARALRAIVRAWHEDKFVMHAAEMDQRMALLRNTAVDEVEERMLLLRAEHAVRTMQTLQGSALERMKTVVGSLRTAAQARVIHAMVRTWTEAKIIEACAVSSTPSSPSWLYGNGMFDAALNVQGGDFGEVVFFLPCCCFGLFFFMSLPLSASDSMSSFAC